MVVGAVDIGGTKIAVGLLNEHGQVLEKEIFPTEAVRGLDDVLGRVHAGLLACLQRQPGARLTGIGVGCTGQLDPASGALLPNAFLPGWEGVSISERMQAIFDVPAAIENDADAAALAEARWGAGQAAEPCLYITVSTGIGGGLVLRGRLYRGVGGCHPEMGHHTIDPSGPACFCGARGCWESLASGRALARWYTTHSGENADIDAREICLRAVQGEALARQAVEREGYYLGVGLANLITLFAPDVIVLGGGVMQSWDLFAPGVQTTIRQNCKLVPNEQVRLVRAALGAHSGLVGAGAVWFHRYDLKMGT